MSATNSSVKLYDKFTGLKLLTSRTGTFPKGAIEFKFEAPREIPRDLVPSDATNARAHINAFQRINDYLKSKVLVLD